MSRTSYVELLVEILAPQGSQVLLRSDGLANISGTKYSNLLYPTWSAPSFGSIAVRARRSPIPPNKLPPSADLILDSISGPIVNAGDPAQGVVGGICSKLGYPVGGGTMLAYTATLQTSCLVFPNIGASNDTGLWQRIDGALQLVAREGAQVDHGGTLSPYMNAFTSIAMTDDPGVGVIFVGVLKNPPLAAIANRVTAKNDEVVYVADATGTPRLLIREGLPLPDFAALGPVLNFRCLGDASPTVGRSYAGDRFAAWVETLPAPNAFHTPAIVILPLK